MNEQIRVLFIDDEPMVLEVVERSLQIERKYLITKAESAISAVSLINDHQFDVIVSDYRMKQMDGIALLKELRGRGDTTPFIIFTGKGREEVVIEALNSGADFYLQKGGDPPAQAAELSNKIQYAVSRKRAEIELVQRNSELESARRELALLNEHLKEQVEERTRDLTESKEHVELLLRQKDQFIYQLAHDLRTPLTPVVAMLPLLLIGIQDPDSRNLLEIFSKSIGNLQQMTEDILFYAQINQQCGINDYADYLLDDLVNDAFRNYAFLIDEKELTTSCQISPGLTIRLSRSQARQLFGNLINNAIKYNIFRGSITVRAYADSRWIYIQIADTGIGIPEERLEQIWDELSTGDSARRDPESKGMGLPIVRRIVMLHDGSISVSSPGTGKGATFKLMLPIRRDPDSDL
jgi:signal transduction histidine kinase